MKSSELKPTSRTTIDELNNRRKTTGDFAPPPVRIQESGGVGESMQKILDEANNPGQNKNANRS